MLYFHCFFCLLFCLKGQGSIFPSYPIGPSPVEIWCKFRRELQKSQLHDQKSMRNHSSTLKYAEIEASLQKSQRVSRNNSDRIKTRCESWNFSSTSKHAEIDATCTNHSGWAEIKATGSKLDAESLKDETWTNWPATGIWCKSLRYPDRRFCIANVSVFSSVPGFTKDRHNAWTFWKIKFA